MTSKDHYNKAAHQKHLIFGFLFTWPHSNTATSRNFTTNLKNIILVCGHVERLKEKKKKKKIRPHLRKVMTVWRDIFLHLIPFKNQDKSLSSKET